MSTNAPTTATVMILEWGTGAIWMGEDDGSDEGEGVSDHEWGALSSGNLSGPGL